LCYSKEVSLIAGGTIFSFSTINFIKYKLYECFKGFTKSDRQRQMILWLTLGYLSIGVHQILEFFAIHLESHIIYKFGLISSISAMYFNMRATESLLFKNYGSRIYLLLIVLCSVHIFSRDMSFQNHHFYIRGESHFYWGAVWMLLFLYWNFLHLFTFFKTKKKIALLLPFCSLNLSFILSALYCYSIGLYQEVNGHNNLASVCGGLLSNFEIVFDAPSIWCVFATLQGPLLLYFSRFVYTRDIFNNSAQNVSVKYPILLTLLLVSIIFISLPLFSALSYKMILK